MSGEHRSQRPGAYHVADPKAHQNALGIQRFAMRPPVKAREPSAREVVAQDAESKAHAEFKECVKALIDAKWSKRAIARALRIDKHHLQDLLDGTRGLQLWQYRRIFDICARVPEDESSEPPPSRTGTEG